MRRSLSFPARVGYQTGPASVEWQGRGLYNYVVDPKLTLGGGFAAGTLAVEDSAGQNYEQGLLRALCDPTEKCSIQIQGGLELRQLGSGQDKLTPVMELNGEYRLRPGTIFDLAGYCRNLSFRTSGNLDYAATGVSLSGAQELGFNWLVMLKGRYENNSYFYTDIRAASPREDNFMARYRGASSDPQHISLISRVAEDPAVRDAQNRVAEEEQVIAGLIQRYRPAHPKYIDA